MCCPNSILQELGVSSVTILERRILKLASGFFSTLPHVLFSFAGLLYTFAVINHTLEFSYVFSPEHMNFLSKLPNLEVIFLFFLVVAIFFFSCYNSLLNTRHPAKPKQRNCQYNISMIYGGDLKTFNTASISTHHWSYQEILFSQ